MRDFTDILLCKIGWHDWGKWEIFTERDTWWSGVTVSYVIQLRQCQCCGKVQKRVL